MADEKQLDELKKEAAAKAKAAVLAKLSREKEQPEKGNEQKTSSKGPSIKISAKTKKHQIEKNVKVIDEEEKAKAISKAKAAAAAKAKLAAKQPESSEKSVSADEEKAKAIALAKAKAAAATKAKASNTYSIDNNQNESVSVNSEMPSVNQPLLDLIKKEITNSLGSNIIEELYINKFSKDIPTLVVSKNNYFKLAKALKENENLAFDYFNLLHGTDFQTHMEVYVQLRSYIKGYDVALKTKLDREYPEVDSLTSLWEGSSWLESEAYDLLGIKFTGNPDLHRIFLGDNWVGYPLRKDYKPFEEEVISE